MKRIAVPVILLWIASCSLLPYPEDSTTTTTTTTVYHPSITYSSLEEIPLTGTFVYGMAWTGDTLYVCDYDSKKLYTLDLSNGVMQYLSDLSVSGLPMGMCWQDGTLYVQSYGNIYEADPATGGTTLLLSTGSSDPYGPTGLASDGTLFYSADRYDGVIRCFDMTTKALVRTLTVPDGFSALREMTYCDGLLWLLDSTERCVHGIDPVSGAIVSGFLAPRFPALRGMEYCDGVWWFTDTTEDVLVPTVVHPVTNGLISNPQFAKVDYVMQISNRYPLPIVNFRTYFAVPQSSPRQEIVSVNYSIQPESFATDAYGQEIAVLTVSEIPGDSVYTITMSVEAKLWAIRYNLTNTGSLSETPSSIFALYTNDDPHIAMTDPDLQSAAVSGAAGTTNVIDLAWSLRNTVLDRISYVNDGVWDTADVVWDRGTGSCSEYSFVYTSLLRQNGWATRLTGSSVFDISETTTNASGWFVYRDDIFHRFPQVYMPRAGWIPADANRDDRTSAPYTRYYFLAYNQDVMEYSHTFFDTNYLNENVISRYSYSRGSNPSGTGSVVADKASYWTVVARYLNE